MLVPVCKKASPFLFLTTTPLAFAILNKEISILLLDSTVSIVLFFATVERHLHDPFLNTTLSLCSVVPLSFF